MRKISRLFLLVITSATTCVCSVFAPINAFAESKALSVNNISILEQSPSITVDDPVISDSTISSAITFNQLNDFVTYGFEIGNSGTERFKIISINDNNASEYIALSYEFDNNYISVGDTTNIAIRIAYVKQLINQNLSLGDLAISVAYESESGYTGEILFVPNTGFFTGQNGELAVNNVVFMALFIVIMTLGVILVIIKRRSLGAKFGAIAIVLALLLIPLAAFAEEKFELSFEFTNLEILGEFEIYEVTINPGGNDAPIIKKVKYGDPIGDLVAAEIPGYDLDKWVDGNNSEITAETIVTGEMNVAAKHIAKTYQVTYNLNNGTLPDGQVNPESYTIEDDNITLMNPVRLGYTFVGWTSDDGNTPEVELIIPKGSTGNKNFTANFQANTNTSYTVAHGYQSLNYDWYYDGEDEPVTYYGTTDATIEVPLEPKYGFENPEIQSIKIEPDGSASAIYRYDRKRFSFNVTDRTDLETSCTWHRSCTEDGSYPYETTILLRAKQRDGYHLIWSDGSTEYDREFPLIEDTTLSYIYEPNHYTVRYNKAADDASGEMADQEFIYDEAQTLHSNEFSRTGYTFGGWGHGVEGSWWHIAPENWEAKNLTKEDGTIYNFYAKWNPIRYQVDYYDKDGGAYYSHLTADYDSKVPELKYIPYKANHTFVGFFADEDYTVPFDFENTLVKGNTIIYIKFEIN